MIAIQTVIFQRYPLEEMLRRLREKGIDRIELWEGHVPFRTPGNLRVIKQALDDIGVTVTGVAWEGQGFDAYHAGGRQSSIDCLAGSIETARALGGSFVTIADPPRPLDVDDATAWGRLVDVLKVAANIAAANGIRLVNEFHPGFFASTLERAPRLIREVDSSAFLACVDLCHAQIITQGRPELLIEALSGLIGHVHIADGDGVTPMIHLPLGEGTVDLGRCIEALKAVDYEGPWTLCAYGCSMPERAVDLSLARLKKLSIET
jgi:sugar phosphate isomerase/epimerase